MSATNDLSLISTVLESMQQIVQVDGGEVTLQSYDPDAGRLVVDLKLSDAADCSDCAIDAPMLQLFIEEALQSHGLRHDDVTVTESSKS